jgi:hypothetical protein
MDYDTTVLLLIIGILSVINLLLLGIVIILIDKIVNGKMLQGTYRSVDIHLTTHHVTIKQMLYIQSTTINFMNDFEIRNRLPTNILNGITLASGDMILEMENLLGNTMEIKLCDMLNKIYIPVAIHIQHVVREAMKYNIELVKLCKLLNTTLFETCPLHIAKEKFILH